MIKPVTLQTSSSLSTPRLKLCLLRAVARYLTNCPPPRSPRASVCLLVLLVSRCTGVPVPLGSSLWPSLAGKAIKILRNDLEVGQEGQHPSQSRSSPRSPDPDPSAKSPFRLSMSVPALCLLEANCPFCSRRS